MTDRMHRSRSAMIRRVPSFAPAATLALALALVACTPVDSEDVTGTDAVQQDTPASPTFHPLYDSYLQKCVECHAPPAPGRTSTTETTLDFSTLQAAYDTLTGGTASGLSGNQQDCNGVRFIDSTYPASLLAAVLDETVRATFSATGQGTCDEAAVSDMTLKVQDQEPPSAAFLQALREWIDAGAPL
mgnify:FL=1